MRKCAFGISDQKRFKPASSASETRFIIEILDLARAQDSEQKGADQTARMRRLICAFIVRICHLAGFCMTWLISKPCISVMKIGFNFTVSACETLHNAILCQFFTVGECTCKGVS